MVARSSKDARGNTFYIEIKAFPLMKDASGKVISAIETSADISERHLLEQERLKTQKLEAIGRLAGGIAHDFNNLLQGVFGYISMAKMNFDPQEEGFALLAQAEQALQTSINLTGQLLTFSKGGKPVKKIVSPLPVIENAAKICPERRFLRLPACRATGISGMSKPMRGRSGRWSRTSC